MKYGYGLLFSKYYEHVSIVEYDIDMYIHINDVLTHWGLVTPFGDIDLGQHWLR